MDAREETLGLLNQIWTKLQDLPNAEPLDLGAFFIILAFICESQQFFILFYYYYFVVVEYIKSELLMKLLIYSHSDGPAHDGADLCELLLLLLQDQRKGTQRLSEIFSLR